MDWGSIFTGSFSAAIGPAAMGYALAAIGLSVHFGYTGLLNFGQAGFMAIGAYGFAISCGTFGLPTWLGILIAIVGTIIYGFILGIPTLRLRGDYLAIVTIAAAEIVRYVLSSTDLQDVTGGTEGISGYNKELFAVNPLPDGRFTFGPFSASSNEWFVIIVGAILVALASFLVWALMRSPWGRVVKGIREDEDAVRSLGKNVYSFKMQALLLGGLFGAFGGIIQALPSNTQPGTYSTGITFFIWTALFLGGAATTFGPVVGAMLFWFLLIFAEGIITGLREIGVLGFLNVTQAGQMRFILVGIALALLVVFRPQGIFGNKKELSFSV
jgi:branched-chain amino acid transport system permease protein